MDSDIFKFLSDLFRSCGTTIRLLLKWTMPGTSTLVDRRTWSASAFSTSKLCAASKLLEKRSKGLCICHLFQVKPQKNICFIKPGRIQPNKTELDLLILKWFRTISVCIWSTWICIKIKLPITAKVYREIPERGRILVHWLPTLPLGWILKTKSYRNNLRW